MQPSPDTRALGAFLSERLRALVTITNLKPVTSGARRINALFDATIDGHATELVITQLPNESDAFRSVDSEVRWLQLADRVGVHVPAVIAWNPRESNVGGPFFITRRVAGVSIPKHVVALCDATPGLGSRVAYELGESLARLHRVSIADLPSDIERPAHSAIDTAMIWADDALSELLVPSPAFALVTRWLELHAPPAVPSTPVHGDARNGNILVNDDGLGALLDWETAHIGEPFEDLAWLAQRMWRARSEHLEIGGFGHRSDLRAGYAAERGEWDDQRFHWWKVYRTLWWGLTLAGQARQHLDGTFRSIVMAASGRRVAELEWDALCLVRGSAGTSMASTT